MLIFVLWWCILKSNSAVSTWFLINTYTQIIT